MIKGKIKKVIGERGFGFIDAVDGREIFFHMSSLQGVDFNDLKEGDQLEFDVEKDHRGTKAVNIKRASDE